MEAITFLDLSQLYEVKNNSFIFIVLVPISLIIVRVFFPYIYSSLLFFL